LLIVYEIATFDILFQSSALHSIDLL
jgi:hypothetical protein